MTHRPRARLLLLTAAVSGLALVHPAHADGMRFTYLANELWGGAVIAAPGMALEPALGPTTTEGSVTFRPSGSSFRITIDDAGVPDGLQVPVAVQQTIGKVRSFSRHCVPVRTEHRIQVAANAQVALQIQGTSWYPWQPCGAPATAGTAEISWG